MMMALYRLLLASLSLGAIVALGRAQVTASITTGNLALGRNITATSTCGIDGPAKYCILGNTDCYMCDNSKADLRHPAQFMIDPESRTPTTWWQAENNVDRVDVRLDFETAFTFTYMVLTFRSHRPAAMVLEKSNDFGRTWVAYQYFAEDCLKEYGLPDKNPNDRISLTEVVCTSKYSDVAPSTLGEVVFSALPAAIQLDNPYARSVLDHLSVTNLRIRLHELTRFGDEGVDPSEDVVNKYHYAVYDWTVRGQCECFGHATKCVPVEGIVYNEQYKDSMIFGKCACTENTEGDSCERCKPLYNSVPWTPGGECKQCQCFGHADRCVFDPDVYERSGRTDGGVCVDCRDNTAGNQCEECRSGYYPGPGKLLVDKDRCRPCDCDRLGSKGSGRCAQVSNSAQGILLGDCECKENLFGRTCDVCREGTWNLTDSNPKGCQDCECYTAGTLLESIVCSMFTGKCNCKRFVTGRQCDECMPGYFDLARSNAEGCTACDCDPGGALDPVCNPVSGQCQCRDNIHTQKCTNVWPGYYFQNVDQFVLEAEYAQLGPLVSVEQRMVTNDATWTGHGFLRTPSGGSFSFTVQNISKTMPYNVMIRYEASEDGEALVTITHIPESTGFLNGGVMADAHPTCQSETPGVVHEISLPMPAVEGEGIALSSVTTCLLAKERYRIDVSFTKSEGTGGKATLIDSLVLLPSVNSIGIFNGTTLGNQWDRADCYESRLRVSMHSNRSIICERLMFSMSAVLNDGAIPCDCNSVGSISPICWSFEGQCNCKPGVGGRRCDTCQPGFHSFLPFGCLACNCDPAGSMSPFCDVATGQCPCIEGRTGDRCDNCEQFSYLDRQTKTCTACNCDPIGSASLECGGSPDGDCTCRPGVTGSKCSQCLSGFYNFSASGCVACNCNEGGSVGRECDETGQCTCRDGVTGRKCDQCSPNSFINPGLSTGCQKCFCNTFDVKCNRSDGWYRSAVVSGFGSTGDDDGWTLTKGEVQWNAERHLLGIPDSRKDFVIWVAPSKFLGNKNTAYTREFQFSLRQNASVPSDAPPPMSYVQLRRNGDPSVRAFHILDPPPSDTWTLYTVPLREGAWSRARMTGNDISSSELNQLLLQIDEIQIATRYDEGYPRAAMIQAISGVRLEIAVNVSNGGELVTHVEQCECPASQAGRTCDRCADGYTRDEGSPFDVCVPCFCFRHSTKCDPETAVCVDCRDNTEGERCDRCKPGFYGDARRGSCLPCQCPGGASGNRFADTCEEVRDDDDCPVRCNCQQGHVGCKCDECDVGYYGQPWREGGGCFNCLCNGNGPPGVLENCDKETGECKTCLYNTTGRQCEVCQDGFYGNASRQECRPCECDEMGSESSICDKNTGQCRCKLGVEGRTCSSCLPNHWGFKDGRGCVPCLCCEGATSTQCDMDTGNCQCQSNIGGVDDIRCCLCQTGFWNYSTTGCQACDCDGDGSLPDVCNTATGECLCKTNVVGSRCDRCREGTSGVLPSCEPCGECFDTWSAELDRIRDRIDNLTSYANQITTGGSVTGFEDEFSDMEKKLANVSAILNATNRNVLLRIANNFTSWINFTEGELDSIRRRIGKVEVTVKRVAIETNGSSTKLDELAQLLVDVQDEIGELSDNMTQVEATTLEGILNELKAAQNRSATAEKDVDNAEKGPMAEAEKQKNIANDLVNKTFDDQQAVNNRRLSEAEMTLEDYDRIVREAERDLCGKPLSSSSCGPCGGVNCGHCGGGPTCSGATNATMLAQQRADMAKTFANEKLLLLSQIMDELSIASDDIRKADEIAADAQSQGESSQKVASEISQNATEVLNKMSSFWDRESKVLSDIRRAIGDISGLEHVSREEFQNVIAKINATIRLIKMDIANLETWTEELENISLARSRAEEANRNAEELLAKAQEVEAQLATAKGHQNTSSTFLKRAEAIKMRADGEIASAEANLVALNAAMQKAWTDANTTEKEIVAATAQADANEQNLASAEKEASSARQQIRATSEDLHNVEDELARFRESLDRAIENLRKKSADAAALKKDADETLKRVTDKANEIKEFEKAVKKNDEEIKKLESQTGEYENEIDALLADIERKARLHASCGLV